MVIQVVSSHKQQPYKKVITDTNIHTSIVHFNGEGDAILISVSFNRRL